jgi:hypothetical protein
MRLGRSLFLALLFVLCAAADVVAHDETSFDKRRATPGVKLELVPLAGARDATVSYQARATGAPRDVEFEVWARDWRSPSSTEIASGVRIDDAGRLVSTGQGDRPQPKGVITLSPGAYPRGAPWEIVLASADRKITAFALVVPRPIRGASGACVVSLQIASPRADRFLALATGFPPGDDVLIESRSAGRVTTRRLRASPAGELPPDLITHAPSSDAERGARYSAKGRSCEVALDYRWGEPALLPR